MKNHVEFYRDYILERKCMYFSIEKSRYMAGKNIFIKTNVCNSVLETAGVEDKQLISKQGTFKGVSILKTLTRDRGRLNIIPTEIFYLKAQRPYQYKKQVRLKMRVCLDGKTVCPWNKKSPKLKTKQTPNTPAVQ